MHYEHEAIQLPKTENNMGTSSAVPQKVQKQVNVTE